MSNNNLMLNYHDACIYESDFKLLLNNEWLNDACINYGMTRLSTCFQTKFTNDHGRDPPFVMKFLDPSVISYLMFQLSPNDSDDMGEFCGLCSSWGLAGASAANPTTICLLIPINDHYSQQDQQEFSCNQPYGPSGNHWSLMMVVKTQNRVHYFHFDSSPGYNHSAAVAVSRRITYIILECGCTRSVRCDEAIFECRVPRQINGYDCGIHVLSTAEVLLEEFTSKSFTQDLFFDPIRLNEYCACQVLTFMRGYPSLCQMGIEKRQHLADSIRLEISKLTSQLNSKLT